MKRKQLFRPSLLLLIPLLLMTFGCGETGPGINRGEKNFERIITLDGGLTETVAALGYGQKIVGCDLTSVYPEWVRDSVPKLGMVSSITIEGLLSKKPDLILAINEAVNPDLKQKLEESGVTYHLLNKIYSVNGSKQLIKEVADILGSDQGPVLSKKIDNDLNALKEFKTSPKVLFIYARGAGTLLVAGDSTQMSSVIEMAGGTNAVQSFTGFKPLTPEALLNANPDIILLFDDGMESLQGAAGLMQIPGIAQTKAGQRQAFISISGSLVSSFGPRVGMAVKELNQKMHQHAE